MTEIKKSLVSETGTTTGSVATTLDFGFQLKLVEVRLEGSILGEHTPALRDFLQNLSYFPGNKWVLHLENLELISARALRVLAIFAKVIRRRGQVVELAGIQAPVFTTMLDLNLYENFSWSSLKRRPPAIEVVSPKRSGYAQSSQFKFDSVAS